MKIVLPYNTHFGKYDTERVVGGIEKFCHQINDTFDDVHLIDIDNNDSIKHNNTKIKTFAKEINADIIISNWPQAAFSGSKMLNSEVPIMFINHTYGGLGGSILGLMKNIMNKNHSCYMVSKWQHNQYKLLAKVKNANDVIIDGYINSSYVIGEKPKLLNIEYDCGTIGRCDPLEKKPFIMKEWLCNYDWRTVVMTNTPMYKKEIKYLDKNSHWNNILLDMNHKDVMKTLSKCRTYFSSMWNETWGITALEALSHGIPLILNTKNGEHASTDLCANKSFYKLVTDGVETHVAIVSFKGIDRKEIQDATWDKHSYEKWKTSFTNAIDRTIEKYKKLNIYYIVGLTSKYMVLTL